MRHGGHGTWIIDAEPVSYINRVVFDAGPVPYENTNNGVRLLVNERWLVISFEEFEQMYMLAKQARENDG